MYSLRTQPFWLASAQPNFPRGFALGRWLALFLLTGLGVLSSENTASAGCDNWLVGSHAGAGGMDVAAEDDTSPAIRIFSREASRPLPAPCNGPNCGKAPKLPPMPVSSSVAPEIKVLGCRLGGQTLLPTPAAGSMFAGAPQATLAGYPLRIDRPPAL